jgi:DNA-directed RNA polymerase specialized sigma24 family protein
MLEELAKRDTQWRKIAFNICKDRELADDLVQEMYLKLADCSKEINDYFVIIVIRNLFLNIVKQNKTVYLEDRDIEDKSIPFEYDDEEQDFINSLKWYKRELILESYDKSFHQIQREFNINYQFVRRILKSTQSEWQEKK